MYNGKVEQRSLKPLPISAGFTRQVDLVALSEKHILAIEYANKLWQSHNTQMITVPISYIQ